jgi:hypothetical protein
VRRGINRVSWSMRAKPPRVPPAAQVAFNSTQGPRVPPGTYTVRMTKGDAVYQTSLEVGLDRRVTFTTAERQAQFDAALRVRALFGEMSDLVYKISSVRDQADAASATADGSDALRRSLAGLSSAADAIRKKIVATTEGGAITGEERLREHMDQLYGAITFYEGRPTDYQLARIDTLERELGDVQQEFARFEDEDIAKVNRDLQSAGKKPIRVPPAAPEAPDAHGGAAEEAHRAPWERD